MFEMSCVAVETVDSGPNTGMICLDRFLRVDV
jgi:hypothetical protein